MFNRRGFIQSAAGFLCGASVPTMVSASPVESRKEKLTKLLTQHGFLFTNIEDVLFIKCRSRVQMEDEEGNRSFSVPYHCDESSFIKKLSDQVPRNENDEKITGVLLGHEVIFNVDYENKILYFIFNKMKETEWVKQLKFLPNWKIVFHKNQDFIGERSPICLL